MVTITCVKGESRVVGDISVTVIDVDKEQGVVLLLEAADPPPVLPKSGFAQRPPRPPGRLWIEKQGAVTVVHFGVQYGSLDVDVLRDVQRRLLGLAEETDVPFLLLDFGDADYFGGGFLSVLVRCHGLIKQRGGQIALCRVRPVLRDLLRIVRLDSLWLIYDSHQQGIQALSQATEATTKELE
ncbi:MAG: STAS domain-containing protein [Planctomycetota bacterium]|nr:STAS domain-containing protein [Planctomycetota bacterium]